MDWINQTKKAIRLIEDELGNSQLSPKMVAKHVHVSESHFTRAFLTLTRFTLSEYIRNRRLSVAAELLQKTELPVLEVALRVGYESPEAFSKAFKRFHGVKPSECKTAQLKPFYPLQIKLILTQEQPLEFSVEQKDEIYLSGEFDSVPTDDSDAATYLWIQCEAKGYLDHCHALPSFDKMVGVSTGKGYTVKAMCARKDEHTVITIPAHRWVVFPCQLGTPRAILQLWDQIYSAWMPKTEYEISDYPQLEVYSPAEGGYKCEIWIAVE